MDYKFTRSGLLNTEKAVYPGVGPYDIPEILPIDDVSLEGLGSTGFNYFWSEKHPEDKVLHFFLDDYQFRRVWENPDKYLDKLRKFRYVIAPDFSLYADHPKAVQIFNHYRKHWCARYWQEHGVAVIPCICWSTPDSFEWCFDGTPHNSTVCVSTIGGFGNHRDTKSAWVTEYQEMYRRLKPKHVILFGKQHPETECGADITVINNEQLIRKATLSTKAVEDELFIPTINMEEIEHENKI